MAELPLRESPTLTSETTEVAAPEPQTPSLLDLVAVAPFEESQQRLDARLEAGLRAAPHEAGLRVARLVGLEAQHARVCLRRSTDEQLVEIAEFVDRELLLNAVREGQWVLLEGAPGETPCVVGVLQTRLPEVLHIKARSVEIEATGELTLRSGRAGLRLRSDGDVELVGSRISAASRGLMRLVGRALRLN